MATGVLALLIAARVVSPTVSAHPRITTTITWDREISAIVSARCLTCHTGADGAPMSLATYEQARPWARAIRHEVLTRRMPKWHAARGYGDFANDPSLSPFEIALVVAWADGGAPRTRVQQVPQVPPLPQVPQVLQVPQVPQVQQEVTLPCGEQALPAGPVLALRPQLARGGSVQVMVALPDGRREILGWFRDFEPEYAPIYWLRRPLDVPAGGRMISVGTPESGCRINVLLGGR